MLLKIVFTKHSIKKKKKNSKCDCYFNFWNYFPVKYLHNTMYALYILARYSSSIWTYLVSNIITVWTSLVRFIITYIKIFIE